MARNRSKKMYIRPSFSNPGMTMTLRSPRYAILEIKLQDVSEAPLWLRQTLNDIGAESACFSSWRCLIEVAAPRVCYIILSNFVISFLTLFSVFDAAFQWFQAIQVHKFSKFQWPDLGCEFLCVLVMFVPNNHLVDLGCFFGTIKLLVLL